MTPQDQTQAEELRREIVIELTNHYIEEYKYHKPQTGEQLFAFARDLAENEIEKLIDLYANQRALELLDELEEHRSRNEYDLDDWIEMTTKRLNLTKEKE